MKAVGNIIGIKGGTVSFDDIMGRFVIVKRIIQNDYVHWDELNKMRNQRNDYNDHLEG